MSVEELSKVIVGSWGADLAGSGEARDEAYAALEDALAQVALAKQVNSQMRYELERARVIMQLSQHNAIYKDGTNLREIESKNFD